MRARLAPVGLLQGLWVCLLVLTAIAASACDRPKSVVPDPAADAPRSAPAAQDDAPDVPALVLAGGRVMTATGVVYDKADIVLRGKEIVAVGPGVERPSGAKVVDVSGKTVTPGLIDTHSHIGVYASPSLTAHADGNEMVSPLTPQVWSADGYWPQDPQIERARAGGVTTMQILPGSANLIGGRSVTVKTYPDRRSAEAARFVGAPFGLKMACGENPKRVYGEKGGPSTRMGSVAQVRGAFQRAVEYRRKWQKYWDKLAKYQKKKREPEKKKKKKDEDEDEDEDDKGDDGPPDEPDRDAGLDTLVGVLEGEILVHNHCYRADEMIIMMDVAEDFGFRIRSFHHAVEAYKIADLLAEHGTAASVWADWWGFKAEAYDGIRENAAMVSAAGARAIIHSDSAEGIQRLNQEAAKAMYAGRRAGLDISPDEALRWVTANPAWALGVQDRVGTLEPGKHADVVVWDGDPFSVYSKAQRVYIEGNLVFDREAATRPQSDFELGQPTGAPGEVAG